MKNEEYKIVKTSNESFPIVVISASVERLYSFQSDIADTLKEMGYSGIVLFDQIGCNGDGISRFQVAYFNGSEFGKRSRRVYKDELPTDIVKVLL